MRDGSGWKTQAPCWELLNERASYVYADQDDQEWEVALPGYGRVFPHDYGAADAKFFTTLLTVSPAGDELTADFAKTLIENEDIGRDDITDFLAISFSSTKTSCRSVTITLPANAVNSSARTSNPPDSSAEPVRGSSPPRRLSTIANTDNFGAAGTPRASLVLLPS